MKEAPIVSVVSTDAISVGTLTRRLSNTLADFGILHVQGELSRFQVAASGHAYGTLKDRDAVISVVCWRNLVARLGRLPKEGDAVVVRGTLDVYGPRGSYQLVATRFEAVGAGDLAARFEELKARLGAEGLFDEEHKQALPFLPKGVGLATASGSAALADLMDSIAGRFPSMMVAHAPCLVQGRGAAESIAKALAILDADADVEVIIVGRGGGSLEDLWAFNEETVVRAIAACRTPVVSAVGHETDTTLADLVADLRAKTPTMAGELVVPVEDELRQRIDELRWELDRAVDLLFQRLDQRLQALAQHRALAGPAHQLAVKSQRLDELSERLDDLISQAMTAAGAQCQALERSLHLARPALRLQGLEERLPGLEARLHQAISRRARLAEERFRHVCQRLDAYSPLGVIGRGYAVLHGPDERTVSRLEQAPAGTPLRARISDGWLELRAEGGRSERIQEASDFYRAADDDPNEESP